ICGVPVVRASRNDRLHFSPVTTPDRRSPTPNVTAVTSAPVQTPPAGLLDDALRALEPTFRLDNLVALSSERALYHAWDRVLKRHVTIRVHLAAEAPGRAWFMRETEALAQLDHPAIRHVYAAGEIASAELSPSIQFAER